MRIANRDTRHYVAQREIFKANNIFSENHGDHRFYVVYSYGHHFPLWVYDRETSQWYENKDKYSVTTSKHKSQSRPEVYSKDFILLGTKELIDFVYYKGLTNAK